MYSLGTTSASDRAIGSVGSGNSTAGDFAHGVLLRNTSGTTITSLTVSYTLEQWRKSGVTAGQAVTVWYKISNSAITALNPNSNSTWTQVTALTLTSPINTATAVVLDGNASANRVSVSNISIPSLSLTNNQYIMIKWEDPDHTGNDHALGIDDVTISWTVPPLCTNAGITSATAGDNTLCPSETTSVTANGVVGTNAVLTWWTGTGGTGTNLGSTNPLTGVGAGTYYALVSADCGTPVEAAVTVSSVSAPSTSSISGNASPACSATGVGYSVTNTSGSTYAWTVPSGATITAGAGTSSITVSFGVSNGNITVQETNNNGCIGSTITLAITLAGCSIDANFSAYSTSVCAGATTTFTNTSTGTTGSATYSWNFGTGASPATATGIGPHTVTYNTVGQSTVVLTVVDGVTNVETKTNYITVTPLPTANAGSAIPAICQGGTTVALGGSFGGSATSALWSDGGAG
jgi:PKD repeat protein